MTTKVEKTITVDVPISTVYNQWTQFEEFPQFMGGVQSVVQLDDQRLRWVAEIAGVRREWLADILEQRPDEKVSWAAVEGATNAGAVYFIAASPTSTQVTLELEYQPEGLVEKAGDALNVIERQAQADLERFKAFIEDRGVESGAWRGEVGAPAVGTPGVELASSQGDDGKAGVSPKAAAAGAVAAAAGIAAVAAASKNRSDSNAPAVEVTEPVEPAVAVEPLDVVDTGATDVAAVGDVAVDPPAAAEPGANDVVVDPVLGTPVADERDRGA